MGRPVGLILLIIGLTLGPGYYIYSQFYTGHEISDDPIVLQSASHGSTRGAADLNLLPIMGPVTLIINVTLSYGPAQTPGEMPINRYKARVLFQGKTMLSQAFTLRAVHAESTPSQLYKQVLPILKVATPGAYTLELEQEAGAEMQIRQASVQLRGGVRHLNRGLFETGLILLAAGVFLTVLAP